jgi:putative PIN family toxin of toxin-antitoxin system
MASGEVGGSATEVASMLRAVMDTNVVVAAMRSVNGASFQMLEALRFGKWQCLLSNHLLLEYEEKLLEIAPTIGVPVADIDGMLTVICAHAEERQLAAYWVPVLTNDPDDEPLVQLAYESAANLVVTHNIRDLMPAQRLGIDVLRPRDFLVKLRVEV